MHRICSTGHSNNLVHGSDHASYELSSHFHVIIPKYPWTQLYNTEMVLQPTMSMLTFSLIYTNPFACLMVVSFYTLPITVWLNASYTYSDHIWFPHLLWQWVPALCLTNFSNAFISIASSVPHNNVFYSQVMLNNTFPLNSLFDLFWIYDP